MYPRANLMLVLCERRPAENDYACGARPLRRVGIRSCCRPDARVEPGNFVRGDRPCARAAADRRRRAGANVLLDRSERPFANDAAPGGFWLSASPTCRSMHCAATRPKALSSAARSGAGRLARSALALLPRPRPDLASIRNEPEFKAVFADIERDMAQQRAASPRARRMRRSS